MVLHLLHEHVDYALVERIDVVLLDIILVQGVGSFNFAAVDDDRTVPTTLWSWLLRACCPRIAWAVTAWSACTSTRVPSIPTQLRSLKLGPWTDLEVDDYVREQKKVSLRHWSP